ncbi:MAG: hypothetical protein RL458_71, partial [Pseudomonadota bacterium]
GVVNGVRLKLPPIVVVTPGARAPIAFAADAFASLGLVGDGVTAASELLTVSFTATAGALHWAAGGGLQDSTSAPLAASVSGGASSVTLVGTASQINAYLSAGKLRYTMDAANSGATISVAASGQAGSSASGTLATSILASTSLGYGPRLTVPAGYTLPTGGELRLPASLVGAPDNSSGVADTSRVLEATISVSGGGSSLTWTTDSAGAAKAVNGTTALAAGTGAQLILRGTAAEINAYVSRAGSLTFTGTGNATLTIAVSTIGGAGEPARISTAQSAITRISAPTSAATLALSVPGSLKVEPGSATATPLSLLPATGLAVVQGEGTLTLTVSVASVVDGATTTRVGSLSLANDDSTTNADGVLIGGSATDATLTGSASALAAYLSGAGIRYVAPASLATSGNTTLTLALRDNANASLAKAESLAFVTLMPAARTQSAGTVAMQVRLPASVSVGAFTATPLALGAALVGDTDPASSFIYTLDLGVNSGSLAGVSFNGISDLDPVGGSVRVSGTISALNAWLAAGKLVYNGEADTLSATLTRGAPASITSSSLKVAGNIQIVTTTTNTTPVMTLPGSVSITPDAVSSVVFAGSAFGTGSEVLTVTVSVASGSLGYNAASALFPVLGQSLTVGTLVVAAGETSRYTSLTLTGTANRLSQFFNSDPGLNFVGASGTAIKVSVARGSSAATSAALSEASVLAYSPTPTFVTAPAITSVPSSVFFAPGVISDLRFDGIAIAGSGTLSLAISLPVGTNLGVLAGFSAAGISVGGGTPDVASMTVAADGRTVTLTGTAAQLQTVLQASSKLRYTGPLTSVTLTLSSTTPSTVPGQTTVTGIQLAEPVQPQGVRLSIPTAIYVTPGAPAPIRLGTTPFTTTETGSISIEIEAERQFLTIDGVKPASAATAWPTPAQLVATTAGTSVTITEGTSFLRNDGVSRNATRFTGTAAALNALFNT